MAELKEEEVKLPEYFRTNVTESLNLARNSSKLLVVLCEDAFISNKIHNTIWNDNEIINIIKGMLYYIMYY